MMNPKILYRLKEQEESQKISSGFEVRIVTIIILAFSMMLMVLRS